jgi:hypothetical protein
MPEKEIPTYEADGVRRRGYSLAAIERCLALGKVVVKRGRKGKILAAVFLGGKHWRQKFPAIFGTGFTFREPVNDSFIFQHKKTKLNHEGVSPL